MIIHLRDISNPDWKAQEEDVLATLKSIGVTDYVLNERIISVDNKVIFRKVFFLFLIFIVQIDKESAFPTSESNNSVRISCKTGDGMHELIDVINDKVTMVTKCKTIRLRLDARSPVIEWLYHNELVVIEPTIDGNYLIFDVVMNESEIGRFRKKFAHLKKKNSQSVSL